MQLAPDTEVAAHRSKPYPHDAITMSLPPTPLPLTGIRVLDLSIFIQGPIAAMLLADWGADVIKIEKPGRGDFARTTATLFGRSQFLPDGRNVMFETANRNKRAVAIDLKKPEGTAIFHRLAEHAQVMTTNLHPDALAEFGVDRATMAARAPHLIYAHSTGFGALGPDARDPCQDTAGMARSGFMMNSPAADGTPVYPTGALSDVLSGTMTAFGVVMALLARERGNRVSGVACSQLSTMMWLQCYGIAQYANTGAAFTPHDRSAAANPLMNMYRCADGRWLACGMFMSERFLWDELCAVLELPADAPRDPRFTTDAGRATHNRELISLLDAAFARREREHWVTEFRRRGYWFAVINDLPDLLGDPQVAANAYMSAATSGFRTVTGPFALTGIERPPPADAPVCGHDNADVLTQIAGYSAVEIESFRTREVI
jgi:crotonobetainyl-CoA:carnitine CoA-transferase CaiB-like acyl-CoA transferase